VEAPTLPDGREYNQLAFQRVNWTIQTPRLTQAVQEGARNPAARVFHGVVKVSTGRKEY